MSEKNLVSLAPTCCLCKKKGLESHILWCHRFCLHRVLNTEGGFTWKSFSWTIWGWRMVFRISISVRRFSIDVLFRLFLLTTFTATASLESVWNNQNTTIKTNDPESRVNLTVRRTNPPSDKLCKRSRRYRCQVSLWGGSLRASEGQSSMPCYPNTWHQRLSEREHYNSYLTKLSD